MAISTSDEVAADEVQENFPQVLERVAEGKEITITDRGVPVAKLIPVRSVVSAERKLSALRSMDEIAGRCRLNGLRIRDLIDEGRR